MNNNNNNNNNIVFDNTYNNSSNNNSNNNLILQILFQFSVNETLIAGANVMKMFFLVTAAKANKLECLS